MNTTDYIIYLIAMAVTTYLVRTVPFIIFRKKVDNKFIKSFLYYIPYAVLGTMTFPVIVYSTGSIVSGTIATIVAFVLAYMKKSMVFTAIVACIVAYLTNVIMSLLA